MSLQALRDLFSLGPERFTTGAFARDADGKPCGPNDERAVCWCLVGAIRKVTPEWRPGTDLYRLMRDELGLENISAWSDANGYDAVMKLIERAASAADSHGRR